MARPTDYTADMLALAGGYLEDCKTNARLPQVAGLALYLDVARSTLYLWAEQHPEFSDILEKVMASQEVNLVDGGIHNKFNPTITKLMLGKHGYHDKQEITGKDGAPLFDENTKKKSEAAIGGYLAGNAAQGK